MKVEESEDIRTRANDRFLECREDLDNGVPQFRTNGIRWDDSRQVIVCIGALGVVESYSTPLVDGQGLVAVHEPRCVMDPV